MKNCFMVLSLVMTFTANVQARTVDGKLASNLRTALINAGAVSHVYTDASMLEVTNVECSQNGGIILLPLKCQFTEDGRLVEVRPGKKSNDLAKALNEAGAKTISARAGEMSNYKVSAKSVMCSTMAIMKMIGCELK